MLRYALLFSNRSEARMKLQDFRGAAEDGDEALKYLKSISALGRTSSWWVVVGGVERPRKYALWGGWGCCL